MIARHDFELACKRAALLPKEGDGHAVRANVLGAFDPKGWPLWVDNRDRSLAGHLIAGGYWESWITIALANRLRPDSYCVDVGANFGYYTLLMAHLAPKGLTIAVEANPLLCDLLDRTVQDNSLDNCFIQRKAAWSRDNELLWLTIPQEVYMGGATVMDVKQAASISCPSITLDTLLPEVPRCDFIKIDAEGAEPEIWEGMQATLTRFSPVVLLEFSPSRYRDPRGFAQQIQDAGYKLATIDGASQFVSATPESLAGMKADLEMLWLEHA